MLVFVKLLYHSIRGKLTFYVNDLFKHRWKWQ